MYTVQLYDTTFSTSFIINKFANKLSKISLILKLKLKMFQHTEHESKKQVNLLCVPYFILVLFFKQIFSVCRCIWFQKTTVCVLFPKFLLFNINRMKVFKKKKGTHKFFFLAFYIQHVTVCSFVSFVFV